jgi:thymidylate synthase ThyX
MYVKIIADSCNKYGARLTTIEAEYPLYIHAQVMTHRVFSRNAQSSRAVPTAKLLELLNENKDTIDFAKNQAGMEAGEQLNDKEMVDARRTWKDAKTTAIVTAKALNKIGVHKQWVNRLLMPFMNIKVIITATEWDNFFKLRLGHDSQPEIQELARLIQESMSKSKPQLLEKGDWHLPYVTDADCITTADVTILRVISAARCSRVSYMNHDKSNPNIDADIAQSDSLWTNGHFSPFEHQATIVKQESDSNSKWEKGVTHMTKNGQLWSANFRGFIQSRVLGFDDVV